MLHVYTVTFQRVEGLTGQNGSVIDGVLTCTYKQSKAAPTNQAQLRNLTSSWYLLVATGTSSNGKPLREHTFLILQMRDEFIFNKIGVSLFNRVLCGEAHSNCC